VESHTGGICRLVRSHSHKWSRIITGSDSTSSAQVNQSRLNPRQHHLEVLFCYFDEHRRPAYQNVIVITCLSDSISRSIMSRAGMTVVTLYHGRLISEYVLGNEYTEKRQFGRAEVEGLKGYSMFTCSHSNIGHTTHGMRQFGGPRPWHSRRSRQVRIGRCREAEC
jgi:hypothetical protein